MLAEEVPPRCRAMVVAQADLGLRVGELLGLTVDDVDFLRRDLRHHYASVLLAAGESVVAVAERLGHENATLVLTTYGHLLPDSEERTRRAVDVAWRAPGVPRGRRGVH